MPDSDSTRSQNHANHTQSLSATTPTLQHRGQVEHRGPDTRVFGNGTTAPHRHHVLLPLLADLEHFPSWQGPATGFAYTLIDSTDSAKLHAVHIVFTSDCMQGEQAIRAGPAKKLSKSSIEHYCSQEERDKSPSSVWRNHAG